MGNPAVEQEARDALEDLGLITDDPAPTSSSSGRGPSRNDQKWLLSGPHYAQFCAFPEPCQN